MAVEESIKIKIQANAEEFKIVSDIINRELGKLGKNFQVLEGDINQASNAMRKFESSSKGFNKGLMNISLILQDLPYGFRGIQNNIPALAQGFGLLYLAISAVTAAMTYFAIQGDKMSSSTKKLFETFKASVNSVASDVYSALKPAIEGIITYIKEIWALFGEYIIANWRATWDTVIKVLYGVGQILSNVLKGIVSLLKGDWSGLADAMVNALKRASNVIVDIFIGIMTVAGNAKAAIFGLFNKDLANVVKSETAATAKEFAKRFKFTFNDEMKKESIDIFKFFDTKKKGDGGTKKLEDNYIEVLKALQRLFKDNIFEYAKYEKEILTRQENLAVAQAKLEGKSQEYIKNIRKRYETDRLTADKELGDKWLKQQEDIYEEQRRIIEKTNQLVAENRANMEKAINKIHDNFSDERLKTIKIETDTALKLHKGYRRAQIKDLLEEKKKLEAEKLGEFITPEQSRKIDSLLEQNAAKLKVYEDQWTQVAANINGVINQLIADSFVLLGEHIGNLMTGDAVEGIQAFEKLLAAALINIGKMLISYGTAIEIAFASPDPFVAIAAGVAAVALGTAIKNASAKNNATGPTKFANGGIISGPTYGLMGEYPGAKNNPEVVAPLDKLKEMMGTGEGQFVLRGQDLVLAMNRSRESLTLRRG